jgi:hypothetical protein
MRQAILRSNLGTVLLFGGLMLPAGSAEASPDSISINVMYEALAPHGSWVNVPEWGEVWRPSVAIVGRDFVPYESDGTWVASEYGWVFESRFDWGWAPFHYGRWFEDAHYGWVWVPDEEWGPAWVDWRIGGGYVGWAPLSPRGGRFRDPRWTFVEIRYFAEPNFRRYSVPRNRVRVAYSASSPSGGRVVVRGRAYSEGPPIRHIESGSGRSIRRVAIVPPRAATGPAVRRTTVQRPPAAPRQQRPRGDDDDDNDRRRRGPKGNNDNRGKGINR